MEANALTATDAPLWDKVQSGIPALTPDFDAEALSESLFGDSSDSQRNLQIQKADFTVNSIIDKINRGKVNLRPSYQREYVWTVKTASKLVESLMLNTVTPSWISFSTVYWATLPEPLTTALAPRISLLAWFIIS